MYLEELIYMMNNEGRKKGGESSGLQDAIIDDTKIYIRNSARGTGKEIQEFAKK